MDILPSIVMGIMRLPTLFINIRELFYFISYYRCITMSHYVSNFLSYCELFQNDIRICNLDDDVI